MVFDQVAVRGAVGSSASKGPELLSRDGISRIRGTISLRKRELSTAEQKPASGPDED